MRIDQNNFVIRCVDPKDPLWIKFVTWLNSNPQSLLLNGNDKKMYYGIKNSRRYVSVVATVSVTTLKDWDIQINGNWCIRGGSELQNYLKTVKFEEKGDTIGWNSELYYTFTINNQWVYDEDIKAQIITLDYYKENILKMKKTNLPEKWYIKGSKELKSFLQSSQNKIRWNAVSGDAPGWGYYINNDWTAVRIINFSQDYQEISLESYKESLIDSKEERSIIGYKCPTDLFGGLVKRDSLFTKITDSYGPLGTPVARLELPKEIVETWEPVFKSEEKVISVGGKFNVTIKNNQVWYGSDNITDFVLEMLSMSELFKFGSYQVQVADIIWKRTGCQNVETKLSDWKEVYKEMIK